MPNNPKLCVLTKSSTIECYWVALIAVSDFRFNIINSIWSHSSIVRRLVLLVGLKEAIRRVHSKIDERIVMGSSLCNSYVEGIYIYALVGLCLEQLSKPVGARSGH